MALSLDEGSLRAGLGALQPPADRVAAGPRPLGRVVTLCSLGWSSLLPTAPLGSRLL